MEQQDKMNSKIGQQFQSNTNSQVDSNPQLEQPRIIQIQQEYPLVERYFNLKRRNQYQNLLESNISMILKKKLFGFTKNAEMFYRTHIDTQLVFQKHPIRGRTIMPLQKFEQREQDRKRTAQIQQKNQTTKLSNQNSNYSPRSIVVRSKRRRCDPLQQMVNKKIEKVDESLQYLLVRDNQKDLIMGQKI